MFFKPTFIKKLLKPCLCYELACIPFSEEVVQLTIVSNFLK